MFENATTELASQYSTRVADDLQHNLKEQDRLSSEIDALQAQLAALRHDQTVLVNIQQALGVSATSAASVPASRTKRTAATAAGKPKQAAKTPAPARTRAKKSVTQASATSSKVPKLVSLVREHLASQSEPRSAAEITTALQQQNPGRTIKTTVVRVTLEGLVAKHQAQRAKQGTSVFYTAPETAEPATQDESAAEATA